MRGERGLSDNDYTVCCTGAGELFYGLLGSFILRDEGWIIMPYYDGPNDNGLTNFFEVPGMPDITAVKLPELQRELSSFGVTEREGFFFEEIWLRDKKTVKNVSNEGLAAVIEVESATANAGNGAKQLSEEYLVSEVFDLGILVCPGIAEDQARGHGFITWGREGKVTKRIPHKKLKTTEAVEVASKLIQLHIKTSS